MGFSTEFGYVPATVPEIIARLIPFINQQFGTSYTVDSFQGTNFYKFAYAIAQTMATTEVDTGEIFNKLQDYFRATNESISVPRTPKEGLIKVFKDAGFQISFDDDVAGSLRVCIDVDTIAGNYAEKKSEIISLLALNTVAGLVFVGAESQSYTFTNGQSFIFSFDTPNVINILLRATIDISFNNTTRVFSQTEVKEIIDANIQAKYQLGNDFEPNKYLTSADLPFASTITLEYSLDDGETWSSDVYEANFDDLFKYVSADIEVIIE